MFTSQETAEAYAAAQQAVNDGEQVFVARIPWHSGMGSTNYGGGWRPETAGVIQAVESAGWRLDRFQYAFDGTQDFCIGVFRRELR